MLGLLVAVMLVVAGVQYVRQGRLQEEAKLLDEQVKAKTAEKAELAQIQIEYETRARRKELLLARINVIEALKAQQSGPVLLLGTLASAVSSTDQLWLTGFDKKGAIVSVSGVALSMKAVADFMTRLKSSNTFKDVDLKETTQVTNQDFASFTFTVQTEMAPPTPAPAQSGSV